MNKKQIEEIENLRKKGRSYNEIADNLKISKRTAYKYGKTVQVGEKRGERGVKAPKRADKEAFAKGVRKADSRTFVQKLVWDTAMMLGCGRMHKGKFRYDMSKKYALQLKNYETVIKKTKGFILPDYQSILSFCFYRCLDRVNSVECYNERLAKELESLSKTDFEYDEFGCLISGSYEETMMKKCKELQEEVEELENTNKELRDGTVIKKQNSEIEELKKRLKNVSIRLREKENMLTRLQGIAQMRLAGKI